MIPKALDRIALPDIHELVDNQDHEGKGIEYKRDLPFHVAHSMRAAWR